MPSSTISAKGGQPLLTSPKTQDLGRTLLVDPPQRRRWLSPADAAQTLGHRQRLAWTRRIGQAPMNLPLARCAGGSGSLVDQNGGRVCSDATVRGTLFMDPFTRSSWPEAAVAHQGCGGPRSANPSGRCLRRWTPGALKPRIGCWGGRQPGATPFGLRRTVGSGSMPGSAS